ncbi:MAG: methyltransferase domain-containing protein, partial [Flavisolibacter sp.]
ALSEKSFNGKKFDIIYHQDVLSHLYDPIASLIDMNRALKENGLLIFETGNIADVDKSYYKYFSQFSYPDHLFFFGEHSLDLLLEQAGFKPICIMRESIWLQLLLQKVLWSMKDLLKDKQILENMKTDRNIDSGGGGLSFKRYIRLFYRYVSYYLIKLGRILPKNGRPLKLVVVAEKKFEPKSSGGLDGKTKTPQKISTAV